MYKNAWKLIKTTKNKKKLGMDTKDLLGSLRISGDLPGSTLPPPHPPLQLLHRSHKAATLLPHSPCTTPAQLLHSLHTAPTTRQHSPIWASAHKTRPAHAKTMRELCAFHAHTYTCIQFWSHLGLILEPCGGHLEAILASSCAILAPSGCLFACLTHLAPI